MSEKKVEAAACWKVSLFGAFGLLRQRAITIYASSLAKTPAATGFQPSLFILKSQGRPVDMRTDGISCVPAGNCVIKSRLAGKTGGFFVLGDPASLIFR
jgi:hypothetical protein